MLGRGWRGAALAASWFVCACSGDGLDAYPVTGIPKLDADQIARDVTWLSDDARGGRGVGSEGLAAAADYLAEGFREAGLEPGAPDGSFFQRFEMPVSIRVDHAALSFGERAFDAGSDFAAFLWSESGSTHGPLVFVGYGISAPELGYDDYAGIDVEGAVVLVLTGRPESEDHPLAGREGARYLRPTYKVANAHRRGARGVLLAPALADASGLPSGAASQGANPTLAAGGSIALGVSRSAAEQLVAAGDGPDLSALQARIRGTGTPASRVIGDSEIRVEVRVGRERGEVANVIAVRPGRDPELAHEAVVVGAHYDHLGLGAYGSLAPDRRGEVHNGADDNASGAAGLLELARVFGRVPPARRTLVLAAFTAEEVGLLGSTEYIARPAVPLEDTVAMLNMDMIGRMRAGELIVFGVETSPIFPALVRRAGRGVAVDLAPTDGGYSASDQTSFYARDIPVLFFFTGTHTEYHTPDDDSARVNAIGESRALQVVYRTARALLDADQRPDVVTTAAPAAGTRDGYGPYLGTIPDFAGSGDPGVLLQAVRRNSPAERAGLRAGDRIVEFDGASIANLEEYAALLYTAHPGQVVQIVVVREGERVSTEAVLGQRR